MADTANRQSIDVEKYSRMQLLSMLGVAGAAFAVSVLLSYLLAVPEKVGWRVTLLVPGVVAGGLATAILLGRKLGYREATTEIGWEGDFIHYRDVSGTLHSIDLRRLLHVEFSELEAGGVEFEVEGGDRISLYPGLGYDGNLGKSLFDAIKAWCARAGRPCHLERRQISRFPRGVFYTLVIGESEQA